MTCLMHAWPMPPPTALSVRKPLNGAFVFTVLTIQHGPAPPPTSTPPITIIYIRATNVNVIRGCFSLLLLFKQRGYRVFGHSGLPDQNRLKITRLSPQMMLLARKNWRQQARKAISYRLNTSREF